MRVVGIYLGHDATAALMDETGTLLAAIGEERLSRVKNHFGFPYRAIERVLKMTSTDPRHVTAVVFGSRESKDTLPCRRRYLFNEKGDVDFSNYLPPGPRAEFLLWMLGHAAKRPLFGIPDYSKSGGEALRLALARCGVHAPIRFCDHHLAHAASAYYASPWEDCLILTLDGGGDGLNATLNRGAGGNIRRILAAPPPDMPGAYSPGDFYSYITKHCGFKRVRHEGKITGLAAYGDPAILYEKFQELCSLSPDLTHFISSINMHAKSTTERWLAYLDRFLKILFLGIAYEPIMPARLKEICGDTDMKHVAAAAQVLLEEVVLQFIGPHIDPDNPLPVCLAGGVFANVRLNQRISELPGVTDVFVYPCMGDGGLAVGACYLYVHKETGGGLRPRPIDNVFYGPGYGEAEMAAALEGLSEARVSRPADMPGEVARMIHEGKVVARFAGRMEYGPRALGHRTILAAPTDPNINDWLNERLHRNEFMPFAPVVLEEEAPRCFKDFPKGRTAAQFMTITFYMADEVAASCPAVCHVDGTCRPQTIRRDQDGEYYEIIKRYKEISGLPMAINTSFNMHEEPIVESPQDAVRSFMTGRLDALALGPFLIETRKSGKDKH